jgi:hypothetical protein
LYAQQRYALMMNQNSLIAPPFFNKRLLRKKDGELYFGG